MVHKLPVGWRDVRLGEVTEECKERNNGAFSWDSLFAVTKAEGLVPMRERVRGNSLERCKVVLKGEFAYNPMRLNIGSIARSQIDHPVLVSPDYVAFRCNYEKLDDKFLEYLRQSFGWRRFMEDAGSGSVRVRIYYKNIADFQFSLPPLSEQKKITTILGSVDEAIQATQAVIDQTRKVKQGLLQQLLTRGIGHTRFKQTEIGEIPEGWEVVRAEEICDLITKGTTPKDKGEVGEQFTVPFLRVQNLGFNGEVDFSRDRLFTSASIHKKELARSIVSCGDVLMNIVGPPLGKVGVVPDDFPEWNVNQAIAIFRTSSKVSSSFLSYWLQASWAKRWLQKNSKKTSGQQNLTLQHCRDLPVALPSYDEQCRIANELTQVDSAIQLNENKVNILRSTKSGLMQDLLTGRVRVDEVESVKAAV